MSLKNVLLPIASPERINSLLPGVARLAKTLHADLTLMRVVDPFREGGPKPVLQEMGLLKAQQFGIERCHIHIRTHSDLVASVADYAREQGIDAIVLPSQSSGVRSLFSRTWSLTKKLLDQSPCPVWLMNGSRDGDTPACDVSRILCAVSGRDLHVLKTAAEVSREMNAKLFVLHVIPEIHEGTLGYGFDDHVALSVENGLELLARLQADAGTDAQPIVHIGSVNSTVKSVAQALNIDLVVMGRQLSKGRSWKAGWQSRFASLPLPVNSQMLIV
jgi:nucleotide-binding universal stress UspA family protein